MKVRIRTKVHPAAPQLGRCFVLETSRDGVTWEWAYASRIMVESSLVKDSGFIPGAGETVSATILYELMRMIDLGYELVP